MRKIIESFKRKIPQAGSFALDLIFPKRCAGCGRQEAWLCPACAAAAFFRANQDCPVCGRLNDDGAPCWGCRESTELTRLYAAYSYRQAAVVDLVKLAKYRFVRSAGAVSGELLADFLEASGLARGLAGDCLVVPVPLHPRRRRWRGFNQAELLSRSLAGRFGWQHEPSILKRLKDASPQASLGRPERQRDLSSYFVVPPAAAPGLRGRRVVLVDDVATSGATMEACAKALRRAGARSVYGLALLRGAC